MRSYFSDDNIYALATAYGKSALAVIRTSGEGSFEKIQDIVSSKIDTSIKKPSIKYSQIINPTNKEIIDDVVLLLYPKNHGYTKEEAVEIMCHGSIAVIKKISDLLENCGFKQALGGEFTFRAFQNGSLSLTEAESIHDIIDSTSEKERALAVKSREGFIDGRVTHLYNKLLDLASLFELQVDYSEDEFDEDISFPQEAYDEVKTMYLSLFKSYSTSQVYKGGVNVVLKGDTNVGKSTLFNALLKSNRSIVSDEKGTTRDFIKESFTLSGILVNLYDTAGFNQLAEGTEKQGVERTNEVLKNADIVIEISSSPRNAFIYTVKGDYKDNISYCAVKKIGIDKIITSLERAIKTLDAFNNNSEEMLIGVTTYTLLKSSYENIVNLNKDTPIEVAALMISDAITPLASLLGKQNVSDDILNSMFSNFCVGK